LISAVKSRHHYRKASALAWRRPHNLLIIMFVWGKRACCLFNDFKDAPDNTDRQKGKACDGARHRFTIHLQHQ
jgi:hypothetical protein